MVNAKEAAQIVISKINGFHINDCKESEKHFFFSLLADANNKIIPGCPMQVVDKETGFWHQEVGAPWGKYWNEMVQASEVEEVLYKTK